MAAVFSACAQRHTFADLAEERQYGTLPPAMDGA